MSDKPKKESGKPVKPAKAKESEISDKGLGEAAGGTIRPHNLNIRRPAAENISGISGPSWVNLMTYRKTGAASEPSANRSVSELFEELSAEKDAG